jgi:site-specific DNA-methyltransferase (adenine-specific)
MAFERNNLYHIETLVGLNLLPENSVDLVVTSPPYNIGIKYDSWDDRLPIEDYWEFTFAWISGCYRVLKPSGRIAINCLYEANFKDNGGRIFVAGKMQSIMERAGFSYGGFISLKETKAHRVKHSAWGSYLRPSAPYLYCPLECILIGYKGQWKKVGDKDHRIEKDLFLECVQGEWKYRAETRSRTKACFSEDIPHKAISMLTYPGDLVLDPFSGSGTTAVAAIKLGRDFIGFDISSEYYKVASARVKDAYLQLEQCTLPDVHPDTN